MRSSFMAVLYAMKILAPLCFLTLTATGVLAESYPSCDITSRSEHELYPNQVVTIITTIKGTPCYKARLNIQILGADKPLYSYQAMFKHHIAIPSELLTEQDAINFAKQTSGVESIIHCKDLEPLANELFYVNPLVSRKEYSIYKSANCKAFYHQTHYEAGTTIVIPQGINRAVPVNDYGV